MKKFLAATVLTLGMIIPNLGFAHSHQLYITDMPIEEAFPSWLYLMGVQPQPPTPEMLEIKGWYFIDNMVCHVILTNSDVNNKDVASMNDDEIRRDAVLAGFCKDELKRGQEENEISL
jgi:hypothetical protein